MIQPLGDPHTTSGGPKTALLTLHYGEWDPVEDDWTGWRESWQGGGEAITLREGMRWSDDATLANCTPIKVEEGAPGVVRLFPHVTIVMTGRTTKNIATGKTYILGVVGRTNIGNTTIRGYVYSDDQLLFDGADMSEGKDDQGDRVTEISYRFLGKKDHTWNQFWNPVNQKYERMVGATTGEDAYSDALFSDLDPANW